MYKRKNKDLNKVDVRNHRESTNKILHNSWNGVEIDSMDLNFKVEENSFVSETSEMDEYVTEIYEKIHKLIENSEFKDCNNLISDEKRNANKLDLNKIYSYIINNLSEYSKIDLLSVLHQYFDIEYNKFYNSLSNLYQDELINEYRSKFTSTKLDKLNQLF